MSAGLRLRRAEVLELGHALDPCSPARGDMLGAFCLSEPHRGSEADVPKTMAVREGDAYVLNDVKQFMTRGKKPRLVMSMG